MAIVNVLFDGGRRSTVGGSSASASEGNRSAPPLAATLLRNRLLRLGSGTGNCTSTPSSNNTTSSSCNDSRTTGGAGKGSAQKGERNSPSTGISSLLDRHRRYRRFLYCRMTRFAFLSDEYNRRQQEHLGIAAAGDYDSADLTEREKNLMKEDARGSSFTPASGVHPMYRFALWCHQHDVYIHPTVRMLRIPSSFRDHRFYVSCESFPQLCPLIAVPEKLVIGFKDAEKDKPDIEFRSDADATGGMSDSDVCSFFFTSLGLLVSDLLVSLNSKETDERHFFANSLHRIRTLHNAPYLDNTVFDPHETCLADVVLQMVQNFINAGPLSGRVSRPELCWATSVALSHATPLSFGTRAPSIGIIPFLHLFPHGGKETNCVVLANRGLRSAERIQSFFREHIELGFADPQTIFVVPISSLSAGRQLALQPMAPICNMDESVVDEQSDRMWRLSCGSMPKHGLSTSTLSDIQEGVFRAVAISSSSK